MRLVKRKLIRRIKLLKLNNHCTIFIYQNSKNSKMWTEKDSPFGILPVELKWKIFDFLKTVEQRKSRLVCSTWLVIIDEKLKCRFILNDQTQSWIFGVGFPRNHLKSITVQYLNTIISVSSLRTTIPQLVECVIGREIASTNILNILQFNTNKLQRLRLRLQNLSLSNVKIASLAGILRNKSEWSNLSTLSITMGSEVGFGISAMTCQNHAEATIQLMKSMKIKALKSFSINFSDIGPYFLKPWNEMYDFILKHGKFLQELKLGLFGKPAPPQLDDYKKLKQLDGLKLKKFSISYDKLHASYANDLCLRMKGLESLEIQPESTRKLRPQLKIDEILRHHVKTLSTLRCKIAHFDIQLLNGFDSLKTLELNMDGSFSPDDIQQRMPHLKGLRKLSILDLSQKFLNGIDEFLGLMVERMPNLEEVEFDRWYFQESRLQILKALPGIRKLTVGPIHSGNEQLLRDFCRRQSPQLSFKIEASTVGKIFGGKSKQSWDVGIIQYKHNNRSIVTPSHNNGGDY